MNNSNEFRQEFVNEINRLSSVFQNVNAPEKLKRYALYIGDLPIEGIKEIVNNFIDTFKTTPLPSDFEKASREWRKQYFLKTGIYYGEAASPKEVESCKTCQDMGVIYAKAFDGDPELVFFRCACFEGNKISFRIPIFTQQLKTLYKALEWPTLWFKPSDGEISQEMNSPFWGKVKEHLKRMRESEVYWASKGYDYEKSSDRPKFVI